MKRLAIGLLLLLTLLLTVAVWVREISITGSRRELVERLLLRTLHAPVRFDTLQLALAPMVVEASHLSVGDNGIAEIGYVHAEFQPWASLREGRPVFSLKVESPMIDLTQLPDDDEDDVATKDPSSANPLAALPALRISRLTVRDLHLRFRMGDEAVDVTAESIQGTLRVPALRKELLAALEARNAQWRRKDRGFQVDTLSLAGGADEQGVWLENGAAEGPEVSLHVSATTVKHRQQAVAILDPAMLGSFVDELGLIGGEARIEGTLSGNVIDPIVDAKLMVKNASFAEHAIGNLVTRFTRKRSRLAFEDIRIDSDAGSAGGAVELVVYREVPIQGDVEWDRVNLEKLLRVIGPEIPFHNFLDGRTQLTGTLDPLDLQILGSGTAQPIERERAGKVATWSASTRITAGLFEGRAQLNQVGNQVAADLTIASSTFDGRIDATVVDLDALSGLLPQPIPQLNATGRGEAHAALAGSVEHPTLRGEIRLSAATLSGTAFDELRGEVSIAAGQLTTPSLSLVAGGGAGELSGTVALTEAARNNWKLALRDVGTNLIVGVGEKLIDADLPIADGTLTASVACNGAWSSARLEADLTAHAIRILDEPFARATASLRAPLPAWETQIELQHGPANEVISVQASGKSVDVVDLSFLTDPIRVAGIERLAQSDLAGSVKASGRLSGRWQELSGKVDFNASGLARPDRQLGDFSLVATGQRGRWNLRASAFDEHLLVDASLRALPPFAYTLAARFNDTNLSPLILGPSTSELVLSGELRLSGDLSDLYGPSGTLRISDFRLQRELNVVEEVEPFVLDITRGRLTIRSLALQYEETRLNVTGNMSTAGDLHVEARGAGDLVLLELFDFPIAAARGPFSLRAVASYSAAGGWRLDGEGAVQDAMVDLGLPVAFTRTQGAFVLRDNEIRIEGFEGRAGGGHFQLSGTMDLRHGPAVEWKLQDVGFIAEDNLELKISGRGKLSGPWERLATSGGVEINNALYDRDFDWADVLPWLLEQLAGRPLPRVRQVDRPIDLNLIVYSRGGVFVDNNLAKLETWLDLQILGNTSAPIITGRIGFLDGEVFLRGRKFSITGGTVDFRDYYRNDPILNITAEGRVVSPDSDYGLTMIVSGTASNPRIQFSASDPTLTQSDVFNLATFGKTSAQLQREGSGVSAADALALVPTGEVEKRVGELVGFDRFQIEATQSRSTGAIEPRVTIGKDLTERLRALVWTSFGVESRRAVQLEYRVSRRISLLSAWEGDARSSAGAFSGDVKFRYEFRRIPFSLIDQLIIPAVKD